LNSIPPPSFLRKRETGAAGAARPAGLIILSGRAFDYGADFFLNIFIRLIEPVMNNETHSMIPNNIKPGDSVKTPCIK
jgi:hypothetical protein